MLQRKTTTESKTLSFIEWDEKSEVLTATYKNGDIKHFIETPHDLAMLAWQSDNIEGFLNTLGQPR